MMIITIIMTLVSIWVLMGLLTVIFMYKDIQEDWNDCEGFVDIILLIGLITLVILMGGVTLYRTIKEEIIKNN